MRLPMVLVVVPVVWWFNVDHRGLHGRFPSERFRKEKGDQQPHTHILCLCMCMASVCHGGTIATDWKTWYHHHTHKQYSQLFERN